MVRNKDLASAIVAFAAPVALTSIYVSSEVSRPLGALLFCLTSLTAVLAVLIHYFETYLNKQFLRMQLLAEKSTTSQQELSIEQMDDCLAHYASVSDKAACLLALRQLRERIGEAEADEQNAVLDHLVDLLRLAKDPDDKILEPAVDTVIDLVQQLPLSVDLVDRAALDISSTLIAALSAAAAAAKTRSLPARDRYGRLSCKLVVLLTLLAHNCPEALQAMERPMVAQLLPLLAGRRQEGPPVSLRHQLRLVRCSICALKVFCVNRIAFLESFLDLEGIHSLKQILVRFGVGRWRNVNVNIGAVSMKTRRPSLGQVETGKTRRPSIGLMGGSPVQVEGVKTRRPSLGQVETGKTRRPSIGQPEPVKVKARRASICHVGGVGGGGGGLMLFEDDSAKSREADDRFKVDHCDEGKQGEKQLRLVEEEECEDGDDERNEEEKRQEEQEVVYEALLLLSLVVVAPQHATDDDLTVFSRARQMCLDQAMAETLLFIERRCQLDRGSLCVDIQEVVRRVLASLSLALY